MRFYRGRHAATVDRPTLVNERRDHLDRLHNAIEAEPGLAGDFCGGSGTITVETDGKDKRSVETRSCPMCGGSGET